MPAYYPAGAVRVSGETLALTSTLASLGCPPSAYQVILYDPAVDFRLHLNPAIRAAAFYDASAASGSRWTSFTRVLSDRDTATGTGTSLDSMQTGDRLAICFSDVVAGFRVTIGNANANAATLAGKYPSAADTLTTLTMTDGTASGGATLAVTGSVTFTAPTDWLQGRLPDLLPTAEAAAVTSDVPSDGGFWILLSISAAADASTSITEVWSLNKNTSRGYLRAGKEYQISLDRRNVGAFEAVLAAASDTLEVTWIYPIGV